MTKLFQVNSGPYVKDREPSPMAVRLWQVICCGHTWREQLKEKEEEEYNILTNRLC